MTTNKSKKGLVEDKADPMKGVFEFFKRPIEYRMPQPRSSSDNVQNLQEHLREKTCRQS